MLSQPGSLLAIMLGFLFGFAAIQAEEIPNGIMPQKRQVVGTGGTTSSTPPTTSNPPTTSKSTTSPNNNGGSSTTIPITSSNGDGTTTTSNVPTSDLTSSTPVVQTTKATSDGTTQSVVKVGSTTIDPATLEHKTTIREPLVTKATKHTSFTSYWTSHGQVYSSVYSTEVVEAKTTGYATATIAPSLAHEGGNGSNLSTNTKKIIGGVVGGIGGAILIGGLAFVAWRLWGKKKEQEVTQEDLYSSDSLSAQKRMSGNTLETAGYSERYSNPNGAVNTASNF
jgi:hypothetical protein